MATAETFEVGTNGAITLVVEESIASGFAKSELQGIDRIIEMMGDPDIPVSEISREIALAMGRIMQQMTDTDPLRRGSLTQRELNDQIKAYAELQKTLVKSEELSKRDVLNLDGPKFEYAFTTIVNWFRTALKDSGVDDGLQKNVMLQFGDLVRTNNADLQKELNRI